MGERFQCPPTTLRTSPSCPKWFVPFVLPSPKPAQKKSERSRGCPSARKLASTASVTTSAWAAPQNPVTPTVAPSGISLTASSADSTFTLIIVPPSLAFTTLVLGYIDAFPDYLDEIEDALQTDNKDGPVLRHVIAKISL